jgi:hypothetical protein
MHRALDAAGWAALDRDRDPGRPPAIPELERINAVTYDRERKARVLLLELEEAVSAKGTTYWRGWAGKARLIAFRNAERNERGLPTVRIYAEEPEPRDGTREAGQKAPARPLARPEAPQDRGARQHRTGGGDLDDPIPF